MPLAPGIDLAPLLELLFDQRCSRSSTPRARIIEIFFTT